MAKKRAPKIVHCKYPKCFKLHSSTELLKDDAIKGGKSSSYYHPDCYHTMQTINKIKDEFYKNINPLMTGKQIGELVSTANYLVFEKKVNVDFLLFALEYYIKYKPGKLQHVPGLYYIVQNEDVTTAWKKEQDRKIRAEMKTELENGGRETAETFDLDLNSSFIYKPQNKSRFTNVLGEM